MASLVYPGDHLSVASTSSVKLGPGLAVADNATRDTEGMGKSNGHDFVVTLPGIFGQVANGKGKGRHVALADQMDIDGSRAGKTLPSEQQQEQQQQQIACWVESNSRRYLPALHDPVLCQITNRGTESYQVTLFNTYTPATLSAFAFEGATKRNKPNLRVGTLLYAQVQSANRHLEVELTCVDPTTGKSNGYGELKTESASGGASDNTSTSDQSAMLWKVSCGLARSHHSNSLLKPSHPLLTRLATHFPFEVAVGVNGFVWVRASNPRHVIAVGKVLEQADNRSGQPAPSHEPKSALEVAKARGNLSTDEIAKIVEPFK